MIAYLRGKILDRTDASLTLLATDGNSGVGYEVRVPDRSEYASFQAGAHAEFFVYTHVREDALDLFGFVSREEKRLFLLLLTVSGIGPKGALAILSGMSGESLVRAILEKDLTAIVAIPGVGKKTAERLLLELAEPLAKRIERGELSNPRALEAHEPTGTERRKAHSLQRPGDRALIQQARSALEGLGFKTPEADRMVQSALSGEGAPPTKVEDVVRLALRNLSQ